jgi:SpoVK/Ycf46/Vps4 family AAA+-type ATPase
VIRDARRHQLDLAQPLECTFTWDDLVLEDTLRMILEDFVFEAHDRTQFWEAPAARRLFPQGRGLVGLFSGPPGTGKTMAAQVIAASLGIDLFRIDLSAVVSKYVGETSQNLQRILSRAEHMDVVLLFDEADALFGKRTEIKDAHDRFANTDTNFLLQALESYGGISILATNKKTNMDQAFIRRIRYVVEFPKPDAEQRRRIWYNVVRELAGSDTLDDLAGDLALLAEAVEVTGAQIKYAVLAAVFVARREAQLLDLTHLLRGLDRELVKEGRMLSDRERARLFNHV